MELILFDRGYPGSELISKLIEKNVYFLMRLSSKSFKTLIKVDKQDQFIELKYNKKLYTGMVVSFFASYEWKKS